MLDRYALAVDCAHRGYVPDLPDVGDSGLAHQYLQLFLDDPYYRYAQFCLDDCDRDYDYCDRRYVPDLLDEH